MSEIALFKNGIPAHLRKNELDETTKALMGKSPTASNTATNRRISFKGGVWRMVVDGKEIAKNEERAMNMVVVAAAAKNSRTFYAKAFVEGQAVTAPDCWSDLGDVPNAKAENPQAKRCIDCPQNQAGSGANGKRACKYSRRLAVVLDGDIGGEVYQLTVPSNSLWGSEDGKLGIEPYAQFLGGHGLNVTDVVTEVRFDTNSSSPKLQFKPSRPLTEDEVGIVQAKGKTPEAQRMIGSTPAALDGAPALEKPKAEAKPAAPKEEVVKEPVKREKAQAATPKDVSDILDDWSTN